MNAINKFIYDKNENQPTVHIINIPISEHDQLYCGKEKKDVLNRVYKSTMHNLPANYRFCIECQTENKKRLGEAYNIPAWIIPLGGNK